MHHERRCSPRVAMTCGLVLAREEGRAVDACTLDVGPGGARVRSTRPLRVDEELRFDLDLLDGCPHIGGRARVLRQHPYGEYALRFEQVSPVDAERLWALARASAPVRSAPWQTASTTSSSSAPPASSAG